MSIGLGEYYSICEKSGIKNFWAPEETLILRCIVGNVSTKFEKDGWNKSRDICVSVVSTLIVSFKSVHIKSNSVTGVQ